MGQTTLDDGIQVLAAFCERVKKIVQDEDIDVIYNADQTAVNYEYLPTKSLSKTGSKTNNRNAPGRQLWCETSLDVGAKDSQVEDTGDS
ncbi:unnamed protein product [Aphanomyces euteiches]